MLNINTQESNPYITNFNNNISKAYEQISNSSKDNVEESNESLHYEAVNVSISTNNIKNYLNVKNAEFSQNNTSAQQILTNILNGNSEFINFFEGKELQNGFSLESIGYEGKAISELNPNEAKELISEGGFFGVEETSSRVTSFVFSMTGDNLESLQESRKGLVQGFEEAKKLFGDALPEISFQTQAKTLEVVDAKIAELMKTDFDKKLEE